MEEPISGHPSSEGEFPGFQHRILVSPAWGRVHAEVLGESVPVNIGARIGRIGNGPEAIALLAPIDGMLLSWVAMEGEPVSPGTPLALFAAAS